MLTDEQIEEEIAGLLAEEARDGIEPEDSLLRSLADQAKLANRLHAALVTTLPSMVELVSEALGQAHTGNAGFYVSLPQLLDKLHELRKLAEETP